MDTFTAEQRKRCMSRIRSKNTTPEMAVRKALTSLGFRYRLHPKNLPGKPDIVMKKKRLAIFVNGCFWHQHQGCKRQVLPKSNTEYWHAKLKKNIENQRLQIEELEQRNWKPIIIWECETKQADDLKKRLLSVMSGE